MAELKIGEPVTATLDHAELPPAVPTLPPVAWSPWGLLGPLAIGLLVAAVIVAGGDVSGGDGVRAVVVAAWVLAGEVLVTRRPLRDLGRVVLIGAAIGSAALLGAAAGAEGWTGAGAELAEGAHVIGVAVLPAVALHLLLALPRGDLVTRARRTTVVVGYAVAVATGLLMWAVVDDPPGWAVWAAGALVVAIGMPSSNRRYLTTAGLDRQRLQWLGCGVAFAVEVALVMASLRILVGWPDNAALVAGAATMLVPLSLAAGASNRLVTRVDRMLVNTVAVAGLTGVVVAVYLVIVLGLGRVPDDTERQLLVLSMVAAGVVAVLYVPARQRLSEVANRLVYGERQAPDEVLRTFGSRLSRAIPMDELLLQLAESLRKTMALAGAEVWTGTADRLDRSVSVPDRGPASLSLRATEQPVVARAGVSGNAWISVWLPDLLADRPGAQLRVAPVTHSGELLGLILAERPGDGDQFTEEDERVLTELARQVALALHNVQLDSALQASLDEVRRQADELRRSRARVVATADEERRKIERNLHDGAQQHLVALAVNLRLTRDIVGEDPESAVEMLDELANSIKDTIQELRDLAHGIFPPLLMDSGLPEALRAAAGRSPLDVAVDVDGIGRYPTEVEAAIYFCCLEALQNAAKHAPDAHVGVKVWEEAGGLLFEVADDGPGFDPSRRDAGHGFVNMSDRLGAIGGSVRWDSTPGEGTTVSGAVPLSG